MKIIFPYRGQNYFKFIPVFYYEEGFLDIVWGYWCMQIYWGKE
jgi:hypothetical protein